MLTLTRTMAKLTWAILALTIVNVLLVAVPLFR